MNLKTVLTVSALALAASAMGCGDVCEDAQDICGDTGDAAENGDAECTGELECTSQCIVDADSCNPVEDEKLAACIVDCG